MLKPCNCSRGSFYRVQRSWWMRLLFPMRRLYQCGNCKKLALLPEQTALGVSSARGVVARAGEETR